MDIAYGKASIISNNSNYEGYNKKSEEELPICQIFLSTKKIQVPFQPKGL